MKEARDKRQASAFVEFICITGYLQFIFKTPFSIKPAHKQGTILAPLLGTSSPFSFILFPFSFILLASCLLSLASCLLPLASRLSTRPLSFIFYPPYSHSLMSSKIPECLNLTITERCKQLPNMFALLVAMLKHEPA